ncbi:uncharacterized protein OCT59_003665 [Rhizophagus irregularis]|uniref:Uncharacterized protein n=3 Tax=Rhizophagus irregularis TaxID=588596 RepID=A0A915ZLM7_9GLOM|nr:hypothetical protein RirG_040440 [Rhizophagus irregularis DAOM 197198w]UZO12115.1 hypothetical protein OCT59_003665 [Rhizophagus irregularis]GBC17643.1 hypothetical protein GLOIN_2v1871175 [Rhizophagus irregularis DAOM 181602=DAOM 197198]CAB5382456.1 unnamed protein product [Rhizophagus irregularis]CAG8564783.1 20144_t:CDS:2 [Rhizophagus irregularis]
MYSYRSSIYHDNIDNVSEILSNLFNTYMDPHIVNWCRHGNIINNNTTNVLNPRDRNFQRFVDAVTNQNIDPTKIILTDNAQIYQQIFLNNFTSLVTFMKFVLGITYLLRNSNIVYLEDVYPFIGITYFIYNKIYNSQLLLNNKSLILQDIRNLWSIFLFRKANSHTNLNGEWHVLVRETKNPVPTSSRRVNLTPAFNIIDFGTTRASTPLSIYIQNSLIQALNDVLAI